MVIALTNAKLLLKLQPYVSDSDDTVSTLASWIAFYQVFAGLLTKATSLLQASGGSDNSVNGHAIAYLMFVLVWGVPSFGALSAIVSSSVDAWRQYVKAHKDVPGAMEALSAIPLWRRPLVVFGVSNLKTNRKPLEPGADADLLTPPAQQQAELDRLGVVLEGADSAEPEHYASIRSVPVSPMGLVLGVASPCEGVAGSCVRHGRVYVMEVDADDDAEGLGGAAVTSLPAGLGAVEPVANPLDSQAPIRTVTESRDSRHPRQRGESSGAC